MSNVLNIISVSVGHCIVCPS